MLLIKDYILNCIKLKINGRIKKTIKIPFTILLKCSRNLTIKVNIIKNNNNLHYIKMIENKVSYCISPINCYWIPKKNKLISGLFCYFS